VNEIGNVLVILVEDSASNNIMCSALEVCNKGGHKKCQPPFNYVLVFHFQKAQHRFCQIMAHCGCHDCVVEDVYCMPTTSPGLNFGAGPSSAGAGQDGYPDLGLNTTTDVLSHLEDAPEST
jgi:hypothetical protein